METTGDSKTVGDGPVKRADDGPVERIDERIDMEIVVGGSTTCAVTLTGTEVECGREILNAVVDNILTAEQKSKRLKRLSSGEQQQSQD